MPKQRKTRKQKEMIDTRRQKIQLQQVNSPVYTLTHTDEVSLGSPVTTSHSTAFSHVYIYVGTDLRRTLFITTAIVLAQIVLYIITNTVKL